MNNTFLGGCWTGLGHRQQRTKCVCVCVSANSRAIINFVLCIGREQCKFMLNTCKLTTQFLPNWNSCLLGLCML